MSEANDTTPTPTDPFYVGYCAGCGALKGPDEVRALALPPDADGDAQGSVQLCAQCSSVIASLPVYQARIAAASADAAAPRPNETMDVLEKLEKLDVAPPPYATETVDVGREGFTLTDSVQPVVLGYEPPPAASADAPLDPALCLACGASEPDASEGRGWWEIRRFPPDLDPNDVPWTRGNYIGRCCSWRCAMGRASWSDNRDNNFRIRAESANLTPPALDREALGQLVRAVWVEHCQAIGDDKPSHLAPWDALSRTDREADRHIGEVIAETVSAAWQSRLGELHAENQRLHRILGQVLTILQPFTNVLDDAARHQLLLTLDDAAEVQFAMKAGDMKQMLADLAAARAAEQDEQEREGAEKRTDNRV